MCLRTLNYLIRLYINVSSVMKLLILGLKCLCFYKLHYIGIISTFNHILFVCLTVIMVLASTKLAFSVDLKLKTLLH